MEAFEVIRLARRDTDHEAQFFLAFPREAGLLQVQLTIPWNSASPSMDLCPEYFLGLLGKCRTYLRDLASVGFGGWIGMKEPQAGPGHSRRFAAVVAGTYGHTVVFEQAIEQVGL